MSALTLAHAFYAERVPEQFNRSFAERERSAAAGDVTAQRMLAAMRTVNATVGIVVRADGEFHHYLDVEGGRMRASETPRKPPFMTVVHDLDALGPLERASGESILGFLGAIAGMPGEMMLTSQRVQNLHGLDGALRFELTGEDGFAITAHFGRGADDDLTGEPRCSVTLDPVTYAELRAGELAPQDAFLSGRVEVDGDMQMLMKIALAALSPE